MIALGVIAPTVFFGLPEFTAQVAAQWGFGPTALGAAMFLEFAGVSAGTLLVAFAFSQRPARSLLATAFLLAVGANLMTPTAGGIATFALWRALAGIGCGALSGIAMRYLSYTGGSERNLGLLVMGQVLWSAILLGFVLPTIGSAWHANGSYLLVALLTGIMTPCMFFLNRRESLIATPSAVGGRVHRRGAYLTLSALFAVYCSAGVVWTFIERIGDEAGLNRAFVSRTLGTANLLALGVCALVPPLALGARIYGWTRLMLVLCAAAVFSLALPVTPALFATSMIVFVAGWSGGAALLFATIPRFDPAGRHVALSPGFLSLGFGIGSLVGGAVIASGRTEGAVGMAGVSCSIACLLYGSLPREPSSGG
jgi:DHA1 family inner membrane transport protein